MERYRTLLDRAALDVQLVPNANHKVDAPDAQTKVCTSVVAFLQSLDRAP